MTHIISQNPAENVLELPSASGSLYRDGLGISDIQYINAHGTSTPLKCKSGTAASKSLENWLTRSLSLDKVNDRPFAPGRWRFDSDLRKVLQILSCQRSITIIQILNATWITSQTIATSAVQHIMSNSFWRA
jgi:hypothetical protein